jgi:hypothetical protein
MRFYIFFATLAFSATMVLGLPRIKGDETEAGDVGYIESGEDLKHQFHNEYQDVFARIVDFFESINKTMATMDERIRILEKKDEIRGAAVHINPSTVEHFESVKTSASPLSSNPSKAERDTFLWHLPKPEAKTGKLPCSEKQNLTTDEFDGLIHLKSPPSIGETFNGSSASEISRGIPGKNTPDTLTVVFENYLDVSLVSFKIHDPYNTTYYTPPAIIPGKAKEVFAFYEPECCWPHVAFSYQIAGTNLRLVAYGHSDYVSRAVRLAFLREDFSMQVFYESDKSLYGPYIKLRGNEPSQSAVISHKHFHAKASISNEFQSMLKIEILETSAC